MSKMIDSNKQKLDFAQIAMIALKNTRSQYPIKAAMPAILTEVTQPNTDVKQMGNTVFILHEGEDGQAFFKALNADTPRNFLQNSRKYVVYAKNDLGLDVLVTEFEDKAISTLFHAIAKSPPMPGMGFKEYKTDNGGYRIVLNLGH
jgi:hypothetical protein